MSEARCRLHPLFVHFPIAFYVSAVTLDLGLAAGLFSAVSGIDGLVLAHALLWAGIATTLPTVAAGLLDYARLPEDVQDDGTLKRHILCMGSAFVLFLAAAMWRVKAGAFGEAPAGGVILLETAGAAALVIGGHLAGRAVFDVLPRKLD